MKGYMILIAILLVTLLIIIWIIRTYNKLVGLRNKVKDQWSQVDVQLKRRYDLIPNLVETVKGYVKHERNTFKEVVEARNAALSAASPTEEMNADSKLGSALNKLLALSEAYPELKADQNFLDLQQKLTEVEDKIAFARQFYNDTVLGYKNAVQMFPTVLIARLMGFEDEKFFEASSVERENVKVKF